MPPLADTYQIVILSAQRDEIPTTVARGWRLGLFPFARMTRCMQFGTPIRFFASTHFMDGFLAVVIKTMNITTCLLFSNPC
jgi:hypothetical protein